MTCGIITEHVNEGTGVTVMMRVLGHTGSGITIADTTSVAWAAVDEDDKDTIVASGTLVVADVIFDTYQTDARWTKDTTGYNFRWAVPATVTATGATTVQVQVTFTPAGGEVIEEAVYLKVRDFWGK